MQILDWRQMDPVRSELRMLVLAALKRFALSPVAAVLAIGCGGSIGSAPALGDDHPGQDGAGAAGAGGGGADGGCAAACSPSTVPAAGAPFALAIDETAIYWIDIDTGYVESVPKAGGAVVTLATASKPAALGLGPDRVYWMEAQSPIGHSVAKTGGESTSLPMLDSEVNSIVADDANVYCGTDTAVWRVPRSGGSPVVFDPTPVPQYILPLTIDDTFVSFRNDKALVRAPKGGGAPLTIDFPEAFVAYAIQGQYAHVVSVTPSTSSVMRKRIDDTQLEVVFSGPQQLGFAFAVDSDAAYATVIEQNGASGRIVALPFDGSAPRTIHVGTEAPRVIAVDACCVYFPEGHAIRRVPKG
jgi:hypothetical protein